MPELVAVLYCAGVAPNALLRFLDGLVLPSVQKAPELA